MKTTFQHKKIGCCVGIVLLGFAGYACTKKPVSVQKSSVSGKSANVIVEVADFDLILSDVPMITRGDLNIGISGENVVEYKYEIINGDIACDSAAYSQFVAVAEKITAAVPEGDGVKTLCVQGKLSSGKIQKNPNRVTFIKRSVEPMAEIEAPPAIINSLSAISLTIKSSNALMYSYAIIRNEDCSTAQFVDFKDISIAEIKENLTADGIYSLCLKARYGELIQITPTKYTWTKDTVAEVPTVQGAPLGQSSATKLNVTVANVVMYQYKLVDTPNCTAAVYGDFISVSVPITDDIVTDGIKTLCIKGKDAADNISPEPLALTWTKEAILPIAEVTGVPASGEKSNKTTITANVIGNIVEYKYLLSLGSVCDAAGLSAAPFVALASSNQIILDISNATAFPDGMLTLCVLGKNATGNMQATPNSYTWEKDTLPPVNVALTGAPAAVNNLSNVNIKVTGELFGYKYVFKNSVALTPVLLCPAEDAIDESFAVKEIIDDLNSATPETAAETASRTITLADINTDGQKLLCVYGRDSIGNYQHEASSVAWNRDTTPPVDPKACDAALINKITEAGSGTVIINCNAKLDKSTYVISKKIKFSGSASSGVSLDCGGSAIGNTADYAGLIHINSLKKADGTWDRPIGVKVSNCTVHGHIVISGMDSQSNYDSSHSLGHTVRNQQAAPTNIILDKLVINSNGSTTGLYINAGTNITLSNSELKGKSSAVAVYLDAETAYNKLINNSIHVEGNKELFHADRELIAIDGSAYNLIANNTFAALYRGGMYLYRNCGEPAPITVNGQSALTPEGTVRHQTSSHNAIINNVFTYATYSGSNPAIFIGSRNGNKYYCDKDKNYKFGSGVSDLDLATDNVVAANQFYVLSPNNMIQASAPPNSQANYAFANETVSTKINRNAGCVVDLGITKQYIAYGQVAEGQTCTGQIIYPQPAVLPLKSYIIQGIGHRYAINNDVPRYNGVPGVFEKVQGYILSRPYDSTSWKSKGGAWAAIYNCINSNNDRDNYVSFSQYCELNGYRIAGTLGYVPSKLPIGAPPIIPLNRCYKASYPEHYLSEVACTQNGGTMDGSASFMNVFKDESFLTSLKTLFP